MSLDRYQKIYIKKNIRRFPVAQIAGNLGIQEKDVHDYLKKKWSREKYRKFASGERTPEISINKQGAAFSFWKFFLENRVVVALLISLVIVSYANSFFNGFVSDDIAGFARNPDVGKFSRIFGGGMHFSLTAFFQFFTYHIGGLHPFSFRIINILFHLGSVILIYVLLSLSMKKQIAIIAAAIFAVHPILTESVSWISGSPYAIYSFFFLLSFVFYLFSENNKKYYYYSIIFFALSIFTSEKATVLFLIFILYELAFGSIRDNWKRVSPYFLISLTLLILFVSKIGSRVTSIESQSYQSSGGMLNPFVQVPIAISNYLKLIFWPAALSLYQTEMAFSKGQFVLIVFTFLIFLGLIVWGYFKNRKVFFWLTFFVITLLPTLTPLKISWVVAERYVYLGTLGIIVAVALLLDWIMELNENGKMIGYFALVLIVASLSFRTIARNRDWKNEDSLWLATAKVSPSGQVIHNNLGDVWARRKDFTNAVSEFKKAIEINPNYADAYHNLGNTYQQMGQEDEAMKNYQKAAEINPQLWQSFQNMASIYFEAGDYERAYANIKKALEINPADPNLQANAKIIEERMQAK
jgi:protein O-mannosyl-transferase